MPDADDTVISDAFERLRDGAPSIVRAPGTRQFPLRAARRRRRLAGLSVAAATLLAAPTVALVSGQGLPPGPPPETRPAAEAKIPLAELGEAGAPVPLNSKWRNCSLRLVPEPAAHTPYVSYAKAVIYTNLDSDPAVETAAFVRCMLPGGGFLSQIVAYDKDASGTIVSLGAIVPPLTPIDVVGMLERADGGVSARVLWESKPSGLLSDPVGQIRDYGWNGKAFAQVGGPTSFPEPLIADIAVSSPEPLHLTGTAGGSAVLKFEVTNNGPNPTRELKLLLELNPSSSEAQLATGLPPFSITPSKTWPPLGPGQSTTIQLPLGIDVMANVASVGVYSHIIDADPRNNYTMVTILRS